MRERRGGAGLPADRRARVGDANGRTWERRAQHLRGCAPWGRRAPRIVAVVAFGLAMVERAAPQQPCPVDCSGDGRISIDELVLAVAIALDEQAAERCPAADAGADGRVTIDDVIGGVRAALAGCAPSRTTTASASATTSATAPAGATATATASATTTAAAFPTPAATWTVPPRATPQPNFIVINLDDTRADGIDRMPIVRARLIDQGVRFDNAFVPLALCCPSRASILTGLYALHHGTRRLQGRIGGAHTFRETGMDRRTIAVWLQDAGYMTGLFGKYLNEYWAEADKGPARRFYVPPGWSRWRAFVFEHYGGRTGFDYELVDESGARTAYVEHTSDAQYSTTVLASELRGFVADAVAARRPFFAVWTPYASHIDGPDLQPIPAESYLGTFRGLVPWRPPNWNELDRTDKPRWVQDPAPLPSAVTASDRSREHAYETLLSVDDEIGRLLDELVALDVDANTVILLSSDNGVFWGEHAQFGGYTKEGPYEECLRVPLVVRDPRRPTSLPRESDTAVLNIDVPVTIAERAGVPLPEVDGISFAAALDGATAPLREDFLLEHWGERSAGLTFGGQPRDGDRIRVYFGAWPKSSLAFEFDDDGTTASGTVAVPLQTTAPATFTQLGALIHANVPNARPFQQGQGLTVFDVSPDAVGILWVEEVDHAGAVDIPNGVPDFLGVRDVANGFTYVEHATGEVELYDLTVDPWQLDNRADHPAYAATRARLAARTRALAQ